MANDNFITLTTIIQRNEAKFLANKLGEEMVMMNMASGDFISMNNVGADIWDLSEQPVSVRELIQKLLDRYEITEEQCRNETIGFLQNSSAQNIFTIHNPTNAT